MDLLWLKMRMETIFSSPNMVVVKNGDESHGIPIRKKKSPYINKSKTSWWFQPIRTICSSKWESSPNRAEKKKIFELPPPRNPRSVDVSTIGITLLSPTPFFPSFSLYGLEFWKLNELSQPKTHSFGFPEFFRDYHSDFVGLFFPMNVGQNPKNLCWKSANQFIMGRL